MLKSLKEKWLRVQSRYKIVNYQGTHILYLRETDTTAAKRVLATHKLFDVLTQFHKNEDDHPGRTKLFKRILERYNSVSENICGLFVAICEVCILKKSRKSMKLPIYKPIASHGFGSRG